VRLSRALGLALVAALLASVFVLSLPGRLYWERVVMDAAHGPVFGGIAVVLLLMYPPEESTGRRGWDAYAGAFLWTLVLGVATEIAQYFVPGRSVSLQDVLHDGAGALLALSVLWFVEHHWSSRRAAGQGIVVQPRSASSAWIALSGIAAFTLLAWAPLQCARAYAGRAAALPQLAPLPARFARRFLSVHDAAMTWSEVPAPWHRSGEGKALRLSFAKGAGPAFELQEPAPDWRGHQFLALDLTNPGPRPLTFVLRILDARHDWTHEDRLNLPVVLPAASRSTVRLSLQELRKASRGREMDLGAIANVMLYAAAPLEGDSLYVNSIRLE
jgi:hypothetical protein